MLELKNIYKKYKEDYVLKNINLSLPNHGLISIIGESGSGKSTLLNLIGLLDKPDNGEIIIDNKFASKLKTEDIDNLHKNYISFIFQQYNLIENMTVEDNIKIVNNSKDFISIVNMLKINHLLKRKVCVLSGGEKQRVVIARSLMNSPRVILADEPTGALDSKNRNIVMKLLKSISKDCLVIMVTHNAHDAFKYSDRIIELKDGVVIKDTNNHKFFSNNKLKIKRSDIRFSSVLKIIFANLKSKFKRNVAICLAFSIGLIAMLSVLSISFGFKDALEKEERENLSKYPIYISESSTSIENDLKEITDTSSVDDNKIYVKTISHINNIDEDMLTYIDKASKYLNYTIYSFTRDNVSFMSLPDNDNFYDEFKIINGSKIKNDNEVIIVIDNDNGIDEYTLSSIGIVDKSIDINNLNGYEFKLNKNKYKVVGVMKAKKNSIFNDSSMLLTRYDNSIPSEIYLYPKNSVNKSKLINYLDKNNNITYTDYATSIKSISETLIKSVSVILIIFSSLSLLVSTIMIGVITYINIVENTRNIGILRSLGYSNDDISGIFLTENVILGFISSVFSILFVLLMSIPVNKLLFSLTGLNDIFIVDVANIIIILLLSTLLCIIGSQIPVLGISKLKIIDTIRNE